ncbi:chemotaxis protein CheW [bacterium]|nr:chemotaxis protein CheW [bacterium]
MQEKRKEIVSTTQVVVFQLGNEDFGVDILQVLEIIRLGPISHVPETPDFIEGVTNLRGNVIPVINLRKKFGLPQKQAEKQNRIVVFEVEEKIIGAIVDHVDQIIRIPDDRIEDPPEMTSADIRPYIKGLGKTESGLVILLNIRKILTDGEIIQLREIDKLREKIRQQEETAENDASSGQAPKTQKKAAPKKTGKRSR